MQQIWDYDKGELEKTEQGRIKILERKINYGPGKEKIKLAEVKKYWNKLHLFHLQKRLFEILLWKKYNFTQENKKSFLMK
ncbi:MAG TPA: hypothetical protein VLG12_02480 [Candidatus Saccharimonadales bacterium]|nr:hypothetical protein [Candidatus Saccharimonadales bacterium]